MGKTNPDLRKKIIDTFGFGVLLWLIGFSLGMMVFPIVPVSMIGYIVLPILTVATLVVAYKRLKGFSNDGSYFLLVGTVWTLLAIALDYFLLVKTFAAENY